MALPTITVVGNLKRIEQKFLPSGKELTKFQVECSEKNSKGEWENLYISGEVWEKASAFLNQYFKDGSVAIVTGKLVTNVYEKSDGTKVYENKFLFPNVSFAPKDKSDNQGQANTQNQGQQQGYNQNPPIDNQTNMNIQQQYNPSNDIDESDIPFAPIGLQYPMMIHSI